jgi:antitoxin (DNA-binding transcriptional repressor) of toxin-antitoxin stability system
MMKTEIHDTITATELVRNLSVVIDRVRMTGHSLYITKGSQTVAKLSPPPKVGLPSNKLAGLLRSLPRLGDDASAMDKDLENIRRQANLPENSWDS